MQFDGDRMVGRGVYDRQLERDPPSKGGRHQQIQQRMNELLCVQDGDCLLVVVLLPLSSEAQEGARDPPRQSPE